MIDLEKPTDIGRLSASFLQNAVCTFFLPVSASYYVSEDGNNFELVKTVQNQVPEDKD